MFTTPQTTNLQASDELVYEPEDPPDDMNTTTSRPGLQTGFTKNSSSRSPYVRRESLLTRQLHASESESHAEDDFPSTYRPCTRALSNSSVAELTSDNDMTSPGTRGSSPSPPLLPTHSNLFVPPLEKGFPAEPVIAGQDENQTHRGADKAEQNVESGLGRRRCITFACGKKAEQNAPARKSPENAAQVKIEEPPKRKCTITFNCPTRAKPTPTKHISPSAYRMNNPTSRSPRSPRNIPQRTHRGSDTTIKTSSPTTIRKVPSVIKRRTKYADDVDEDKLESKRFHEFAVDAKGDEEWTEESTCHRKRLTIKDTLHKENLIRQMGEEVAEEEAEEEDDFDDDVLFDDLDAEDDDDDDDDDDIEDDEMSEPDTEGGDERGRNPSAMVQAGDSISDRGFDTDDEEGFANSSESEGDNSDFEWWAPGRSTAATSTDHIEHIRPSHQRKLSDSSLESAREANDLTMQIRKKSKSQTPALKINRAPTPELPDSTDFVCGTLDEDRPMENAYKLCLEQRKAAKHKITPQDIDPTFPTSDPEMDEEDEEDEVDETQGDADDGQLFMHGQMDMNDERGRRSDSKVASKKKSPSPRRLKSPPPRSRANHRSPPPQAVRRPSLRSPPPPAQRNRLRSPPPRKLFGHSPTRMRSPPPSNRPTSPPNSRSSSVECTPTPGLRLRTPDALGTRPVLTKTASLPRVPTMTKLQTMEDLASAEADEDDGQQLRSRGAIDIVKGLEKKRQRRREKLYQKHCQKVKKEGERKPRPGKGAERMRELGLELAAYRGKKVEHMLSI